MNRLEGNGNERISRTCKAHPVRITKLIIPCVAQSPATCPPEGSGELWFARWSRRVLFRPKMMQGQKQAVQPIRIGG